MEEIDSDLQGRLEEFLDGAEVDRAEADRLMSEGYLEAAYTKTENARRAKNLSKGARRFETNVGLGSFAVGVSGVLIHLHLYAWASLWAFWCILELLIGIEHHLWCASNEPRK
jgi:hypothetical protein